MGLSSTVALVVQINKKEIVFSNKEKNLSIILNVWLQM